MNELALFAGAGGGILGGHLLGWRTVCAVEIEKYPRDVLLARQRDGILPYFPIWDDIRTFDGTEWRGRIDVISGGFPCQDISAAGKGAGITGERSGLWSHMARITSEVRPRYVFVENSPLLVSRGLDVVLSDFAAMGYDAEWGVVGGSDAIWLSGIPKFDHVRYRLFLIATCADVNSLRQLQPEGGVPDFWGRAGDIRKAVAYFSQHGRRQVEQKDRGGKKGKRELCKALECFRGWWSDDPDVVRMVHGIPFGVDRIKALGNVQIPAVAALAWTILRERLERKETQ